MDIYHVKKTETNLASKIRTCKRSFTWTNQQIADWLNISVEIVNKMTGDTMEKLKKRHIVCYTVSTGLMENDEWISLDSRDEAYDLYQELQTRDNVSSVIIALPLEGVEYKNGKKK